MPINFRSFSKTLLPFLRHVMFNLRGGFLVRPVIITVCLGCAGLLFSVLETHFPRFSDHASPLFFPSDHDPQLSQIILSGIAGSMMTVVSIVFAILLMTLTLASMQYSPRILVSFVQDKVTQQTLGIFLGTFAYCLAALPAARTFPHPFAPVLTTMGAMLLALACVGWLLFFIHHISQAIGVNNIVDRIACDTEIVINDVMPDPLRSARVAHSWFPHRATTEAPVVSDISGYVRFIDVKRLLFLTKQYGIRVNVLRRVGHFVPEGVPIMMVSRAEKVTDEVQSELRSAFDFGPTRTLQQDVEFGILQIVDIALKAISPAVNDPSTCINCIDQLSRILIRCGKREPAQSYYYDPPGVLRVSIPWPGFDRLLESAFEQIRLYSRSDVAVSLRLLRALTDITFTIADHEHRLKLVDLGRRIVVGCYGALGEEELSELRKRLTSLEAVLHATSGPEALVLPEDVEKEAETLPGG